MKKVVLYVRVSTDEQAKLGYSLGHQETVLTRFAELKELEVVKIFREDHSAKNFNRPEYKKLFKFCKANKKEIDFVLITKWDRFSRNQRDALQEIKSFADIGIEVNAAEQWIDLSIPHNKMMLSIYLTIPEVEKTEVQGRNNKAEGKAGRTRRKGDQLYAVSEFGSEPDPEPPGVLQSRQCAQQAEARWFNLP